MMCSIPTLPDDDYFSTMPKVNFSMINQCVAVKYTERRGGRWQVWKAKSKRSSKNFLTQETALEYAMSISKCIIVHNQQGDVDRVING